MPLGGAGADTLTQFVAEAARLRSAAQALLLAATAALEADREGSGRTALREHARLSARSAKRTAQTSDQVAQMPNTARGLATGALTAEHAEVLADAARHTSPEAVDTAVELLEAAAVVPPEVLRRDARDFAARHDPDTVRSVLDRQRRQRSAALFIDHSTGMGVLNARLDPVSFALVQQAVENYCDALWRADGGRDGTPDEIRDNPQRIADAIFEMLADRNALATIAHPTAPAHTSNRSGDTHRTAPARHHTVAMTPSPPTTASTITHAPGGLTPRRQPPNPAPRPRWTRPGLRPRHTSQPTASTASDTDTQRSAEHDDNGLTWATAGTATPAAAAATNCVTAPRVVRSGGGDPPRHPTSS